MASNLNGVTVEEGSRLRATTPNYRDEIFSASGLIAVVTGGGTGKLESVAMIKADVCRHWFDDSECARESRCR